MPPRDGLYCNLRAAQDTRGELVSRLAWRKDLRFSQGRANERNLQSADKRGAPRAGLGWTLPGGEPGAVRQAKVDREPLMR